MDKMDNGQNGHFAFMMQNDVFSSKKRTLCFYCESVKIAEKVQDARNYLEKVLAFALKKL